MAFHPFGFFRKRQKSLLAALTILSMFIFILTGFSGSIVDRLGGWFGHGRKDSTEVTKLYGSAVTVGELDQLSLDRRMANTFMQKALGAALPNLSDTEYQEVLGRILQEARQAAMMGPGADRSRLMAYRQELLKANRVEAARFVEQWLRMAELTGWQRTHPGQMYFGGGLEPDDLLDFLVWREQADRLKITLTDEDLRKAVNAEAGTEVLTGDPAKDAEKIAHYLGGQFRNTTPKNVYDALRDEFRVRLAKEVLLGSASSARAAIGGGAAGDDVPGEGTPDEFWDFYKKNREALKLSLLKVPVQQFTEQVKKEPTQQELEDLYRRGKNDEPSPDRSTFGFRQPRRVKVEWVTADPTSPHYREAAEKALPVISASGPLALLTLPGILGGGSPVTAVAAAGQVAVGSWLWDAPMRLEYESYVKGIKSWWDASNVIPEGNNPYATGLRRPETVASVIGQVIGSDMTGASRWTAVVGLNGATELRLAEQKARQASMVLAGAGPFPLAVAAQQAALADVPVPSLDKVRPDLANLIRERVGSDMANTAMDAFIKDLEAKRFSPKDAADFVTKNATIEHGITGHGVMAEARDEETIADDPALAPLRRALEASVPLTPSGVRQFADRFFTTIGEDGRPKQTQPYQPRPLTDLRGKTTYYYWLTESDKAKQLTFAEAKPKVEEAWKFIQARKEAKQAADDLVDQLKKRGEGISAERFLKDKAEELKAAHPKAGYGTYDLLGVSRLVRSETPILVAGLTTRYEPYKFPETTIAYPKADTVEELFKQLKQPGDAMVFADRPERNYYVAVLEERKTPTEKEFFDVYQKAPRGTFFGDSLWARFQAERDQDYRKQVMRHLREESKAPLDDQGNYRMDPEVRKRIHGGGSEE